MLFWFKKKPIVLYCYNGHPANDGIINLAPISKAIGFTPEWWKTLKSTVPSDPINPISTMKHCQGFVDLYRHGVIMPMWCDLVLKIGEINNNSYEYRYSDGFSDIKVHSSLQNNNHFTPEEYQHLKLNSPWQFFCDEEVKFLFSEPTWTMIDYSPVRVLPGVVEFKYQHGTNINLMVKRLNYVQDIFIPFREPLVHILPLSDRPLKLVLTGDDVWKKRLRKDNFPSKFTGKYRTNKRLLKDLEKK